MDNPNFIVDYRYSWDKEWSRLDGFHNKASAEQFIVEEKAWDDVNLAAPDTVDYRIIDTKYGHIFTFLGGK